ncbi:glycosyltransferase family 4 protein [Mucilaginibacter sp.]
MRICFFINSLNGSAGTERITVLLANYLAENGYSIHIVTQQGGNQSFFPLNNKIQHHYLFENSGINIYSAYAKGLKKYKAILNQIAPDYVVDVCVAMSLLTLPATIFNKKIKIISWEHFNANAYFNIVTAKLSKYLASKFAYSMVVLTEIDKNVYNQKFKPKKIAVIKNPVTVKTNSLADLNSKYILTIGRLTSQKGFDMLLDAWKKVEKQAPDWKLRIVGAGELEAALKKQCDDLELNVSVQFIEPTLQVADYYLNAAMFVMSSRFEGLPLVLIEAKAYGLPIVSFDCETGPREIIRNGVDGILVPPNNIELLAESILDLINDNEKRHLFGKNSQHNINEYSQENFYNSWKQLFDSNA